MKRHLALLFSSFVILISSFSPAATGDFMFQKRTASGAWEPVVVTPQNSKNFAIDSSGNLIMATGGGTWASLTGNLSDNADLTAALNAKLSTTTAASTYQAQTLWLASLNTVAGSPPDTLVTVNGLGLFAALETGAAGYGLLNDATQADLRTSLGLGTLATQSATITDYATKAAALTTVAFVGDSIMLWTGNGNSVDEELFIEMHGNVTGSNHAMFSYGMNLIAGTMTDDALATSPKILIVEGGVNDIIAGASFATYEAKYDLILSKCHAANCHMMVEEIWPARGFVAMDDTKSAAIIAWNAALTVWVAANEGVELIEIYDALEDPGAATYLNPAYTSDGIHPNGTANLGVEAHAAILKAKLEGRNVFTPLVKGLVPASGGGTTNYLRADGTWAAVSGGVTSVTGTANQITVTGTTTPVLSLPATITGLTSVTSTTFVGSLTGTASGNAVLTGNAFTGANTTTVGTNSATPTAASSLTNSTAAISGTQSASPALIWTGQGWKTTSTAASQAVAYRAYVLPVQGTTNPTGLWTLQSSINGGAYSTALTVDSAGLLTTTSAVFAADFRFQAGTTGSIISPHGGNILFKSADEYVVKLFGASKNVVIDSTGGFGWSSGSPYSSDAVTLLEQESAGVVQVNNGTLNTRRDMSLRSLIHTDYIEGAEMTPPGNAAANKGRLYWDDSGGKTRLMVIFPTGAPQQISIEP